MIVYCKTDNLIYKAITKENRMTKISRDLFKTTPAEPKKLTLNSPITYETAKKAEKFFTENKNSKQQNIKKIEHTINQLVIKGLEWSPFIKTCSAIKNLFCHGTFEDSVTLLFKSIKTDDQKTLLLKTISQEIGLETALCLLDLKGIDLNFNQNSPDARKEEYLKKMDNYEKIINNLHHTIGLDVNKASNVLAACKDIVDSLEKKELSQEDKALFENNEEVIELLDNVIKIAQTTRNTVLLPTTIANYIKECKALKNKAL